MKKHLIPVALLVVMFVGCANWIAPKRVAISTDATFRIPIGEVPIDELLAGDGEEGFSLTGLLSPEGIVSNIDPEGTMGIGVYEYTADKKDGNDEGLTYLMHYHLTDFSQDVGALLGNIDFSSGLGSFGASSSGSSSGLAAQEIKIPEMTVRETVDVFDVSSMKETFLRQLNSDLLSAGYQVTIPETGSDEYRTITDGFESNIINIEVDYAEKITYSQNTAIVVDISRADSTYPSYDYSIQLRAYITDWTGNVLSGSETDWKEMKNGGTLELPFAGEKPSQIKVVVEGRTKGGYVPSNVEDWHKYDIALSLSNFGINKVTGITASAAELGIALDPIHESQDIPDVASIFSDLKIKKGSITVKANKPDGWENVDCSVPVSFWGAGIPETDPLTLEDAADKANYLVSETKDLAGLTLEFETGVNTLTFDGSIDLSLDNATIDFTKIADGAKITAEIAFAIEEIEEATVKGSEFIDEVMGNMNLLNEEADSIFGGMIKSIDFSEVIHTTPERAGEGYGFKITVNNTLPERNNIPFRFVSEFLNYDSDKCKDSSGNVIPTLPANVDGKPTKVTLTNFGTVTFTAPAEGEKKYIDLSVRLPETFKLYDIEIGKAYTLGINDIEPVFDWDKAEINYDEPLADDTIDLSNYNIAEMLESFNLGSIGLPPIDAYVFVSKSDPNFMSSAAIAGSMELTYVDNNNTPQIKPLNLTGHICVPGEIEWPEMGKPFTTLLDKEPYVYLAKVPFGSILADNPTNLKLDFEIGLQDSGNTGALRIDRASLDNAGVQTISVDIAIKVPLDLTITEPMTFDLMEMSDPEYYNKMDEDLLQRNQPANDFNDGGNGSMFGGNGNGGDDGGITLTVTDVLSRIKYLCLNLNLKNKLLIVKNNSSDDEPLMKITIKDENIIDAAGKPFKKEIAINADGNSEIKFEGNELSAILDSEVFHPSIILTVGSANTTISINDAVFNADPDSNESLLSASMIFEFKLDGDNPIVFDLSSGEGNGGM